MHRSRTFLLNTRFKEELAAKPARSWVESYLAMRAHRMRDERQRELNPHLVDTSGIQK